MFVPSAYVDSTSTILKKRKTVVKPMTIYNSNDWPTTYAIAAGVLLTLWIQTIFSGATLAYNTIRKVTKMNKFDKEAEEYERHQRNFNRNGAIILGIIIAFSMLWLAGHPGTPTGQECDNTMYSAYSC